MKILALNKRVRYDYEILEIFEAGLALYGFEVKSVKNGHLSLQGAYVVIKGEEAYLLNATISPYQSKNTPSDYEPARSRKLLLHKKEIKYLIGKSQEKGLTLVPIQAYTKKDKIKLEFGVGRGKRKTDKRELIKKREVRREIERKIKEI
jgi:SsrA-binding protein